MCDNILESVFLDTSLWSEAIAHGVDKHIAYYWLEKLADPHERAELCVQIAEREYHIQPPHTGYKKKDDGGERMFLANEPLDRLLLNVIYKWLMRNESNMIHPSCKSYQSGIGIGKIVKEISRSISCKRIENKNEVVGRKFDIHKYFDSIGREYIHDALRSVEDDYGSSSILDLLHDYYDSDLYFDTRQRCMVENYQGIKQGCAVSSWLANVLLYELDEELSLRGGLYVRYSDDILYIGEDYEEVTNIIQMRLAKYGLKLNEKKISDIVAGEYFCFLGFEIHGSDITLSKKWVKHFRQEIDRRTICNTSLIQKVRRIRQEGGDKQETRLIELFDKSIRSVARFLLYGNGRFSWTTMVLPTINNISDLQQLTTYTLDALRAVYTGHTNIGGLGKSPRQGIQRGRGRHVRSNTNATQHLMLKEDGTTNMRGFLSLLAAKKAVTNKWLFRTISVDMVQVNNHPYYGQIQENETLGNKEELIATLESLYETYLYSKPDGERIERFYALPLEQLSMEALIQGSNRLEALTILEQFLIEKLTFSQLQDSENSWYWQSTKFPQLVLLRDWFYNTNKEV